MPVPPDSVPAPPDAPAQAPMTEAQLIACDVAMRWLWDYVDGRLPDAPRAALEAHLAVCAACPTHVAFARAMCRALADVAAPMPAEASAEAAGGEGLRARVQRALAGARADATAHARDLR